VEQAHSNPSCLHANQEIRYAPDWKNLSTGPKTVLVYMRSRSIRTHGLGSAPTNRDLPLILKLHGSSNWKVADYEFQGTLTKNWGALDTSPGYVGFKGEGTVFPAEQDNYAYCLGVLAARDRC
jgi:hypothetical protein